MRIPILAYRPMHLDGNDYRTNDLRALASDLRTITEAGFSIVPLREIVDAWLDNRGHELNGKLVAIASDDGADWDFRDLPHPRWGVQRSLFNVLRDFQAEHPGRQPRLNVTCFSIVSPEARVELDKTCMVGQGWWTDAWWKEAIASGLIHIASHSWDHNHETLPASLRKAWRTGTFSIINSEERADHEIRAAAEHLRLNAANPGAGLFAYPYGDSNPFLVRDYFPRHGTELGIAAAFTARAGFLEPGTGRWEVPRFVCGRDWTSPAELREILDSAADAKRAWSARREPAAVVEAAASPPVANGSLRAFDEFVSSRVDPIPGWMHAEAALLTAHLASAQRALGLSGPTLEIGVYRGKYLSVLYQLSGEGEIVVGVDLFVGSPDPQVDRETAKANVAAACGDASRLKIVIADSMDLTPEWLRDETGGGRLRFVSIDGGHTRDLVKRDLENATPLLAPGGIMALDDAFNFGTPGVIEGITDFFRESKPPLAPFAVCYNKLFVTTPDYHERYVRSTLDFIDEATWLPTREPTLEYRRANRISQFTPTMFGYEVVPFA